MIEQVRTNPAMPIHWGSNQPGMQADAELTDGALEMAKRLWLVAAQEAADTAVVMATAGLHKQVANRILEPFQWMHTIVTATEWDNFFHLRLSPMAQPEFRMLATLMNRAMKESTPVECERHIPYVSEAELAELGDAQAACLISAARCARVSYLNHDGSFPTFEKDLELAKRLHTSGHASPFEHIAFADPNPSARSRNFQGWTQFRAIIGL